MDNDGALAREHAGTAKTLARDEACSLGRDASAG
jgi:hypothetical protein